MRTKYASNLPPGARSFVALGCVGLVWTSWGGCSHDWDAYLPPEGSAGGGGQGGNVAGPGGAGGTGLGGQVPGTCPVVQAGSPLAKVPTPQGAATCVQTQEVTRADYQGWLEEMAMATGGSGGSGGGGGGNGDAGGGPVGGPECDWNADFLPAADWPPGGVGLDRPVAHVDWCDARSYCVWYGMRLCGAIGGGVLPTTSFTDPSASEWFNACTNRGNHSFPYGDEFNATTCQAGNSSSAPVGSNTGCKTQSGIFDMSGNVWEWEDACSDSMGATDSCRIRGGGFNNADDMSLSCAADSSPVRDATAVNVGFRCCADAEP
jgi:formylglycine-generating enzyme required for sulfatase activity